jgi:hypothetical protein
VATQKALLDAEGVPTALAAQTVPRAQRTSQHTIEWEMIDRQACTYIVHSHLRHRYCFSDEHADDRLRTAIFRQSTERATGDGGGYGG